MGVVRYDCTSQYVGTLQQCMLGRKAVGNSKLLIFQDISAEEVENFEVPRNGQVRAAIVTNIPESESNSLICTAPSELTVTAVRWCANSLVDLTNNIVAATAPELFVQLAPNDDRQRAVVRRLGEWALYDTGRISRAEWALFVRRDRLTHQPMQPPQSLGLGGI